MMSKEPLTEKELREAMKTPKRIKVADETVEQHSLREQIEMDMYIKKSRTGTSQAWKSLKFSKLNPCGGTGEQR